jgi:multiple sugar transport system substrate-binding protein
MRLSKWLLTGVAALAFGGAALAQDKIEVWHHGGRGDGEREEVANAIERWNAMHPDMQAELVLLPEGSYNEQVQAAALAGDLPDLLDFDGPNYANYAWSGYLAPLNDIVSQETIDNEIPSLIAQGTYPPDDKLYSLGQFDSGLAVWGNKAYLEEAGVRIPTGVDDAWTMEEFEDALSRLQALPQVEYAIDLKLSYGKGEWYTYGFSPIIQSLDGDLINRETWKAAGTLDASGSVDGMTHFQEWVQNGYVVPASAGDDAFYGKKNAALAFVGHWMWTPHHEGLGDDLVLLPMPKFGDKHVTGMGSWCWGITSSSDKQEATGQLLEFLLQDDQILPLTNRNGAVPGTKTAIAKSDLYKEGGPLNLFVEQLDTIAVPRPVHPAYPTITSAFAQVVADAIDGADVAAALASAAADIDQDIEDNQGYPPFASASQ